MPNFADMTAERNGKLNILCYGKSQTKKTKWIADAAEAGWNVVFLMGEQNYGILRTLSPAAKKRVTIIRCWDTTDESVFASFIGKLCKDLHIVWDDDVNKFAAIPPRSNHAHIILRLKELTRNTIIVLDSLTALADSITRNLAKRMDIDLVDGEKAGDTRQFYGIPGTMITAMLGKLTSIPAHFVCIAHEVFVELKKKDLSDPKKDIVIGYRTQPISSSMPHAQKLSKMFQEVLYFNMIGTGYFIDTTTTSERDGGSRIVSPQNYAFDKLSFVELVRQSPDIEMPQEEVEIKGLKIVPAGGDMEGAFRTSSVILQTVPTLPSAPAPVLQAQAVVGEQKANPLAMILRGKTG